MMEYNKVTNNFTDLDMNFTSHPINGDLVKKYNDEAIKTSVKHLVLYNFYEKPYHPEISSGVTQVLFDNADKTTINNIESRIINVLARYEPRVESISVVSQRADDPNAIDVQVYFRIINRTDIISVNILLSLVR